MIPVMIPSSATYLSFLRTPPPSVGYGEVKVALRQCIKSMFHLKSISNYCQVLGLPISIPKNTC